MPPVVAPAAGANLGAAAPADAVVLFDGRDLLQWRQGTEVAKWQAHADGAFNSTGTSPWEAYAQVLLCTNEFLFVD